MRRVLQIIAPGSLMVVLLLVLALGSTSVPVSAQNPTPTPIDPIWRGFAAVRDAIEEDKSVDLSIVQNWEFAQTEFIQHIDDCRALDDPLSAREIYFGWVYTITSINGQQYQGRVSFDLQTVVVCDEVNSVVAAAPSTDSEVVAADTGDLPAAVAGSANVNGFELGGHVLELNSNTVNLMNRAGMTWVKKQVRYNRGDDPSSVAGLISSGDSNGFNVLLGIVGEPDQLAADFEGYTDEYASFLGGVAALGVEAIEVWNEPNIDREWPAGSINGGNYTRMLAKASNAIRNANPSTLVISGAPAPTGFFGAAGCTAQGCNDDVFMQQMAAAGAAQYMDCVGLHYNEGIIAPSQNSGDPRGGYPTYYFSSMTARGYNPFGGKPVCYTELGYLSGDGFDTPIPASFGWASDTTVSQHAAWLAEAAQIAAQSGRVRLMIVWNVDFPFYTATDPMGGYAMFRPDGSCPACDSLGSVMGG